MLNKITNIIGAAVGIIQLALPIIKEAIVTLERVCGLIFFWTDFDEKVILKINQIYTVVYNGFEKFKNLWLLVGRR
jgi:hypothetical protein